MSERRAMPPSFAALHLPGPSGSQFQPYRRQTALRSVAADELHAATIGSTLCANELRCQEERTIAPHCRRSAARFTLTLCSGRCPCPLPAVRGQRSVNTLFNAPTPSPDVDVPLHCGCVRRAQSAQESVTPAVIGSLWTAFARAHTLSPLQVGGRLASPR